jgi:hypothetical protein
MKKNRSRKSRGTVPLKRIEPMQDTGTWKQLSWIISRWEVAAALLFIPDSTCVMQHMKTQLSKIIGSFVMTAALLSLSVLTCATQYMKRQLSEIISSCCRGSCSVILT